MDELARLSAALRRADNRAAEIRAELTAAIYRELDAGTKQSDIARRTGFTREWLRQLAAKRSR